MGRLSGETYHYRGSAIEGSLIYQLEVKWDKNTIRKFVIIIIMYEKYQGKGNDNFSKVE